MQNSQKFSIGNRLKSFGYAFNGIKVLFREEHNAWLHTLAAVIVIIGGFYFDITSAEWISIVFAIGFVIVTEIVNTSIENIADFVSPGKNHAIGKIKDLGAAAVLISAVTSLIIGLIIFIPKLYTLW